jgi:hypothetical protein
LLALFGHGEGMGKFYGTAFFLTMSYFISGER